MKCRLTKKLIIPLSLGFVLSGAAVQAADLGIVTWYEETGGIKGALNHSNDNGGTSDTVGGVDICLHDNDNANGTPGCDMANEPGYNDGGTPQNGADDSYDGDLIVRTNDAFITAVNYNVNNGSDTITLTGTAPAGLAFDTVPGFCGGGSSLSADSRTITCAIGNKASGTSQVLAFTVNVLGGNQNGTEPGVINFTVSGESEDTASASDNTDVSIKVTAAPRWNIRKQLYTVNAYTTVADDGTNNYADGTPGWRVYYKYYLEVWNDTTPSDVEALLGNASLGDDVTVTFDDDISHLYAVRDSDGNLVASDGAELMTCRSDQSNGGDPYTQYNADHPERSLQNSGSVSCTQSGGSGTDVSFTVSHADLSMNHIPTRSQNGGSLPAGHKMGAIGTEILFIPVADAQNNGGHLPIESCFNSFDPDSISGVSNFGGDSEATSDNCHASTLHVNDGSWGKYYRLSADPISYELPGHNSGMASSTRSGDGWVSPGEEFASYQTYTNVGGVSSSGVVMCDVIDAATYDVVDLTETPGSAVNIISSGYSLDDVTVEYATGYVAATWPPAADSGTAVNTECTDAGVTWYSSTTAARDSSTGPITKVKVSLNEAINPAGYVRFWIKNKARSTYAQTGALPSGIASGDSIANGAILPNFATYTDAGEQGGNWYSGNYDPKTTMNEAHDGSPGDRLGLTRALIRIDKETAESDSINSVGLGRIFGFVLKPHFTSGVVAGEEVDDTVSITDILPPGLSYVSGSAMQGANSLAPLLSHCTAAATPDANCTQEGETILAWNLGTLTPNDDITPITFDAEVDFTNANGTVLANEVYINSPSDASVQAVRSDQRNVVVSVPRELIIAKSVDQQRYEVKDGPYTWTVNLKNATPSPINHLDVIDILPFNGDGNGLPFGDNNHDRLPISSFSGELNFVEATFTNLTGDAECGGGAAGQHYYFTNSNPAAINLDPKNSANDFGAGSIWCEGSTAGPGSNCGFTNSEITAFRVITDNEVPANAACKVVFRTMPAADATAHWNLADDIYTNNAGAAADELQLPVSSNDVSVTVYSGSIGNRIWFDTDKDGIQDAGELGAQGVKVRLCSPDTNTPLLNPATFAPYEVTTDADGNYLFTSLLAGDYRVCISPAAGYGFTSLNSGSDDAVDSDVPETGRVNVILGSGENNLTIDAGLVPIVPAPAIDIEKLTNGYDADSGYGPHIIIGDPVEWTYVVTNTGNVELTNVAVTDSLGANVSCPRTTLAPSETMTCTATGIAAKGLYTSSASVTGTPPGGGTAIQDTDTTHHFGQNSFSWILFTHLFQSQSQNECPSTPDYCFLVADGDNQGSHNSSLFTYDFRDDSYRMLGRLGVGDVEAIALSLDGRTLYAANENIFGIIDQTPGARHSFVPVNTSGIGTGSGELGDIEFNDIDGLSFDPTTNILFATVRRGDGTGDHFDLLIQIDHTTGRFIENAFGEGMDYVVIDASGLNVTDVDDIAINAQGIIYGVAGNSGGGGQDRLVIINRLTGEVTDHGPLHMGGEPIQDVEGLTVFSRNSLYGTSGFEFSGQGTNATLFHIDRTSGESTSITNLARNFNGYVPNDFEAITCFPICN